MKKQLLILLVALSLSSALSAITFNATVPSGTYQCWIAGNFCGWYNNKHQMTKVDPTHYTLTINEADFLDKTVNLTNIEYKYLQYGGDWAYVERGSRGEEIPNRTYHEQDTVIKWGINYTPPPPVFPGYYTIKAKVPSAVNELYLVGNFCNWALPTDSTKMKLVEENLSGKIFSKTIWTENAQRLVYRFVAGPAWDYDQTVTDDFFLFDPTQTNAYNEVNQFKAIYDSTKIGDVNMTINVPLGTESVWIQGSLYGWNWNNPDARMCTKVADGKFIYTVKRILQMEYRLFNKPAWDFFEIDSLGYERANRKMSYPADANLEITVKGWKKGYTPYIDKQAPSQPTGLHVTLATLHSILLSWNASTDNVSVTSYDVYKDGVFYANVSGTWLSVLDLASNTSYSFTVVARDAAGNQSIESEKLIAKTHYLDLEAPSQPTGLTSTLVTSSIISLKWNASTDNESVTGYDVYKDGVLYYTTTSPSIYVSGLSPSTTYSFTVIARDSAGNSSLESDKLVVVTQGKTDGKPITFNVTVPSETYQCWVVGNFCGWNNNKYQMSKVDARHYTLTINEAEFTDPTVNISNLQYKYLKGGGDWAYVEKGAAGEEIPDRSYHERDTVLSWAQCYCGYEPIPSFVTIYADVPSSVNELYLVGNFCGWSLPTDSTKMNLVETNVSGKRFSLKIWTNDARKLQYKFCAGPTWDYEQTESENFMMSESNMSEDFVSVSSFKAIYDSTKLGDVNMTINVPLGTDSVWIQGSLFGWNWNKPAAQLCTKVADGKFIYTVKRILQMEYRMYDAPDWSHVEIDSLGKERANRKMSYPTDANTEITVYAWKFAIGIQPLSQSKIYVRKNSTGIVIEGVEPGEQIAIYNLWGVKIQSSTSQGEAVRFSLPKGAIYLVRIGSKTVKVAM